MKFKSVIFGVAISVLAFGPLKASVIDTPGNGNSVNGWGPSIGIKAFGVVFTAPDPILNSYALTVFADNPFPFVSQIFQFTSEQTVGSALYTSSIFQTTLNTATFTFSPDLALVAGQQYIAIVTNQVNGVSLGGSGFSSMSSGDGNNFRYTRNFTTWSAFGQSAQFHAEFSAVAAVPEPSTWAMMLLGFAGIGFAAFRRSTIKLA